MAGLLGPFLSPTTLFLAIVTAILGAVVILMFFRRNKGRLLRDPRHVEFATKLPGPPEWPVIGNGLSFAGNGEHIMRKLAEYSSKYGSPYRLWLGSHLMVSISNPEDLEAVFLNSKLLGKPELFRSFQDFWGDGIFTGPVHIWKKNRKKLQPTLGANVLESYVPQFNEKINETIQKLKREQLPSPHHKEDSSPSQKPRTLFDLWSYLPYLAFDIITQTSLDVQLNSQDKSVLKFHECVKTGMEVSLFRMMKPWLHIKFLCNLIYGKLIDDVSSSMLQFSEHAVESKMENLKKMELLPPQLSNKRQDDDDDEEEDDEGVTLSSFLSIVYRIGKETGNDKLMHDEIVTMVTGGTDTTAITNSFFLLMMAVHPDIQDKVYDELYDVFGDSDRDADATDMKQLTYLEQTLKETLRRFTLVPILFREVAEDAKIGEHTYPAGVGIIVDTYGVHFNPKYYPDPYKFNPDNFLPEVANARHKLTFLPFSAGPRNCIGQAYAMLEMKLTLSALLRHFEFSTNVKMEDIKMHMGFLMTSADGYKVRIKARDRRPSRQRKSD